jgi:hypothetical protein
MVKGLWPISCGGDVFYHVIFCPRLRPGCNVESALSHVLGANCLRSMSFISVSGEIESFYEWIKPVPDLLILKTAVCWINMGISQKNNHDWTWCVIDGVSGRVEIGVWVYVRTDSMPACIRACVCVCVCVCVCIYACVCVCAHRSMGMCVCIYA